MGRPRKPTSLKILHGDRADRINDREPVPAATEVRCPSWLSADARKVWRRLAPDLIRKKVLTAWDVDSFATVCELVIQNRVALADVAANGNRIVVLERELSDGTRVYRTTKNPNWQIADESTSLLATLGGRFGLNPADRAKLAVGEEPQRGQGANRLLS